MRELLSAKQLYLLMERERGRADRNDHEFSVIILALGQNAARGEFSRRVAQTLFQRVRFTDDAGWLDERHLGLVLPDTSATGAQKLANDLRILFTELLPAMTCEIITYPSDWFDEDASRRSEILPHEAFAKTHAHRSTDFQSAKASFVEVRKSHMTLSSTKDWQDAPASKTETSAAELLPFFVRPLPLWKRSMDIAGGLVGIILLAPALLLIALAIKLNSRGPVFFMQKRIGQGNSPFMMYKFRSMTTGASEELHRQHLNDLVAGKNSNGVFKLTNDPRTTAVGKFIRKWSLDELPQLLNVLKSEMTLVGPRPEPCYASANYQRWYHRRALEMKPGITGLWQIEGRSRVPYEEMIRMDLRYCQSLSLWTDLKLLCRTFKAVLSHAGAY